eukprot:5706725-Karenia_brevis.AAC.1
MLKQLSGPDPPLCDRFLSSRQVFRAVGGTVNRGAPGHIFEDTPEVLSNLHIVAQVIWFNDDA